MFLLSTALKNVRRYLRKSVLYLLICLVSVLTLQIYLSNIDKTEAQLQQLPAIMPISGQVTISDGTQITGLQISDHVIDGLLTSSHVEQMRITSLFYAGIGEFTKEEERERLNLSVMGLNTISAMDGLSELPITWLDGYTTDMFETHDAVCVMDASTLQREGLSLGDSMPLNLYYYKYEDRARVTFEPMQIVDMRIVGEADLMALISDAMPPQILLPFELGRDIQDSTEGITSFASSASFRVRDALKINEFKAEMKALPLSPISPGAGSNNNRGTALLLNDATFLNAATHLQESLSLLRGFLPMLVVVLAAIGDFVSYLMIQNRREEYALLRLLGLSKGNSMGLYFIEMALLTLCGSIIGVIGGIATGMGSISVGITILALFCACFMAGSAIALWRLGRTNVMLALAQSD